jgi:hypothetical protein
MDNERPFKVPDAPKTGLISRLLGRVPREAAFAELRDLWASTPYTAISPADVRTILAKAGMTPADAAHELATMYEQSTLYLASDSNLTAADLDNLSALQRAFELDAKSANNARTLAVSAVYRRAIVEALAEKSFSPAERDRLDKTAEALGLSKFEAAELFKECARTSLQAMIDHAVADRSYTAEEERAVEAFASSLGVTLQYDEATAKALERFRQIGRTGQGDLPNVAVNLLLQRGEVCHFAAPSVVHKEMRVVTKRVNYSGPAVSLRIMKGVRWRAGSVSVDRVSEDVLTQVDSGDFYITNKRVFFQGVRKNTSIQLGKVMQFTVYRDGLRIEKAAGKDMYVLGTADWELAGTCLDGAAARLR